MCARTQDHEVDLCVPDERTCLVPAASCVYNDSPGLHARIDRQKLLFVSPHLPAELCQRLGIKPLSAAVTEHLAAMEVICSAHACVS